MTWTPPIETKHGLRPKTRKHVGANFRPQLELHPTTKALLSAADACTPEQRRQLSMAMRRPAVLDLLVRVEQAEFDTMSYLRKLMRKGNKVSQKSVEAFALLQHLLHVRVKLRVAAFDRADRPVRDVLTDADKDMLVTLRTVVIRPSTLDSIEG